MNYPFWDTSVSYGLLIAFVSILHVFISHFAIGGGLYLVVTEWRARKRNDAPVLGYLERLSRFFVLVTLVAGALTGVGIWFVIGLLSPAATEVLIHSFIWGWATEWTFFIIEITAAILYYYGWKRMSARSHLALGWIYFGAAWMSLFVINGIITFMLTPGEWLATGDFWDGFFNPTFWPSLAFRTGISVMLAGAFTMLLAARRPADAFKARLVRTNAAWGLTGLVVMLPSFYWYWTAIPGEVTSKAREMMPTVMTSLSDLVVFAIVTAVLLVFFGLIIPKRQSMAAAIVLMAFGLLTFGAFEWFRESVRKPWIVYDYMYGNALEAARADSYSETGYLEQIRFRTGDDGADLFRRVCRNCHTIAGYKPLKPAFDGTDEAFTAAIVKGIGVIRGNMPPFHASESEAGLIAAHLYGQMDGRSIAEIYRLEGVELGRKVYDIRCGKCHVMGGYNDKYESLVDLSEEDYNDLLDIAGEFGEEMPDYTGDDQERRALIQYLLTLGKEDGGSHESAGL
ncbi:MAG TPA: c-type cytochrome [Acidobacteriota bacterium]|nr:c-type cytochrome [Acidobacteriota bacterium]